MAVVYVWTHVGSGRHYVGKGSVKRARQHPARALRGSRQSPAFYSAIRKYGPEAFTLVIVEDSLSDAEALQRECFYIALLGSKAPSGFNLTEGGDGAAGAVRSAESKTRYAASKTGERNPRFGRPAHNKGVPVSDAFRAKVAAAHERRDPSTYKGPAGRVQSPEERLRRGEAQRLRWQREREARV